MQLPQVFLAKVDATAVKTLASISKVGPGVTVNSAGQVLVKVGIGKGIITGVTRNGAAFAYTSSLIPTESGLLINPLALPSAVNNGDAYVASIMDSHSNPYLVNFTTNN